MPAIERVKLDLPVLLPAALDRRDRCVQELVAALDTARGIDEVHLAEAVDGVPATLCLHYDPAGISLTRINELATAAGATLTDRYGHVLWRAGGIGQVRRARRIAGALRDLDGVVEAEVTPGLVRVEFLRPLVDERRLREELDRAGVHVAAPGEEEPALATRRPAGPFRDRSELLLAITSATLWLTGFALSLVTEVGDGALNGVFVTAGVLGGWFTLRETIASLREARLEIDLLMLVAAVGAASLGKWEEGALLLVLFSVGHALEGYAMGRARQAVEALAELTPTTALVRDTTGEHEVPVDRLAVGDVVVIKPNQRIAADGFVIAGASSVNQAPLTGESIPVDKLPAPDRRAAAARPDLIPAAHRLFSGTINGSGQLELQVTRRSTETALAKLTVMVREAQTQASPTQRFTDRFERVFVPVVLGLVAGMLAVGFLAGNSWTSSFYRAMAVLVAASPCALAIATPSAVLAAVARAGQFGVLVKGGAPLEDLGTLRAVAFDKTGTLTEGRPRLTDVIAAAGVDELDLLAVVVAVESGSDHPLAAAIVRDAAARLGDRAPSAARAVTALTGRGVRGVVDETEVLIGNVTLFDSAGGVEPAVRLSVDRLRSEGRTVMIVKRGSQFLGVLGLMDAPRASAKDVVAALHALGIRRTVMISGDHQLVADSVASQVGLSEAWGDLMPKDKVTAIEQLRAEEGKVAMVGDGVNDAPALAHATVGIAMGAAGSDVALETADVALMGDDLGQLPVLVGLSRRASRTIRENLLISLGVVAVLIPPTIAGVVGIGPAVVLHEGSTLVVVANALRLLGYRRHSSDASGDEEHLGAAASASVG